MKKLCNTPEIMSPAGDFVCLDSALKAGADAIYFGLKGTNMRVGAKNFEIKDLKTIAKKCKEYNAKAYLTLNNIYYQAELKILTKQIKEVKKAGIDAVIAWDFSVINIAKEIGVEVFLSTQASVSNSLAIIQYHKNFGIKRFVLARECTLEQIKEIRKDLNKKLGKDNGIELEIFAHGAMCVSVSGRCFLSEFTTGKSANKGSCLQLCRRSYKIVSENGDEFELENNHILSPKDLCSLPFIEKLFIADSLKIEGRNRNAEYVYKTTLAYKTLRDFYIQNHKKKDFKENFEALKNEYLNKLQEVFHRGFSDGFFMGRPIKDWHSQGNYATAKKVIVGRITNFFPKISVAEISIDEHSIKLGQLIQIEGQTSGFAQFNIESIQKNSMAIDSAKKGMIVAIKTPQKVRKNDKVYTFVNK